MAKHEIHAEATQMNNSNGAGTTSRDPGPRVRSNAIELGCPPPMARKNRRISPVMTQSGGGEPLDGFQPLGRPIGPQMIESDVRIRRKRSLRTVDYSTSKSPETPIVAALYRRSIAGIVDMETEKHDDIYFLTAPKK
jgi:hypothetical protein